MAPEPFRARAALFASLLALLLFPAGPATAVTPNGRLQIIHLDVGQGDGALIISPLGQVVMIDDGLQSNPTPANGKKVTVQLQELGVTHVDYHFASHYHADHIGSFVQIFGASGIATLDYGWDRGGSYTTATYTNYATLLGARRRTLVKNQVITLDSLSAHPVTIKCVALAGDGVSGASSDENSLCLVLKVSYGEYDELFGGDLTGGAEGGSSANVESKVALQVGPVEAYKAHHHGSRFSSNDSLMHTIVPKVAVVSCGNGNSFGHPTPGALGRIHAVGTKAYWTELGAGPGGSIPGAIPDPLWDKVSNDQVVISATWEPGGVDTIRGTGFADTFINSGTPVGDTQAPVADLTAPNGGEQWKVGSSHALMWSASDNVGVTGIDLAWSSDGGSVWTPVAAGLANTGTYPWVVPASATTAGRVRVIARDAANNLGADSSLANFTVDWWTIAAGAGAGGTITPSGTVNVAEGANSPFSIAPGSGFQIADLLVDGAPAGALAAYQFDAVAAHHTIAASFLDVTAPSVSVTSPAGGEEWPQGSLHDITWTATDNLAVSSVSLDYSAHGPSGPWVPVAQGLANTGSYPWTVPSLDSDSALVRVTAWDAANNSGAGTSLGLFQLGQSTTAANDAPPSATLLYAPFPNPIAGRATVRFDLAHAGDVALEVFDLTGRRASTLLRGALEPGRYSIPWNGLGEDGVPVRAGLYFVRLKAPGAAVQSARVTVVH